MPIGVFGEQGAYLDGASGWYPRFNDSLQHFDLTIHLPDGWQGLSQGRRTASKNRVRWQARQPQDDIYLLAGPFRRYQKQHGDLVLSVYLLKDDPSLADSYLQTSALYIDRYSALLGPYPYSKFAVVENRWQTGYGMPSFTLLGSRVMRLPFILHSSLPHEILHNWWGNGVYVDYRQGNWSEGLTAYLADHLIKEQQGQGADYRRKALQRYANFAARGRDFALSDFRSRHSEASQAIGYSKSLMLFHMIRHSIGEKAFYQALRTFYARYQFHNAGFTDLLSVFTGQGLKNTDAFAAQWLLRSGAPQLALSDVESQRNDQGWRVSFTLSQTQDSSPYRLQVPVHIQLADQSPALQQRVELTKVRQRFHLQFDQQPEHMAIDPAFDLFRLLDASELPPSLGSLYGAKKQLLVLPSNVPIAEQRAWQALAQAWQKRYQNLQIRMDDKMTQLPADTAVWIAGWNNQWTEKLQAAWNGPEQSIHNGVIQIGEQQLTADNNAVVLLSPGYKQPLALIAVKDAQDIKALARKLPHYSSFGRLIFDKPGMKNRLREGLTVKNSALSWKAEY